MVSKEAGNTLIKHLIPSQTKYADVLRHLLHGRQHRLAAHLRQGHRKSRRPGNLSNSADGKFQLHIQQGFQHDYCYDRWNNDETSIFGHSQRNPTMWLFMEMAFRL
ncbi:uncharacterized protein isoform X4 [Macaca fascicularis]|uniref:uncharacterized protein isoform X4 n=1 Tax=Macaca fascicularis TaxID=9541 RepID=UPI0032B0676D